MGDQRWLTVLRAHNAGGARADHAAPRHRGEAVRRRVHRHVPLVARRRAHRGVDPPLGRLARHAGPRRAARAAHRRPRRRARARRRRRLRRQRVHCLPHRRGRVARRDPRVGRVRELADSTSDLAFGESREVVLAGRTSPPVHTASADAPPRSGWSPAVGCCCAPPRPAGGGGGSRVQGQATATGGRLPVDVVGHVAPRLARCRRTWQRRQPDQAGSAPPGATSAGRASSCSTCSAASARRWQSCLKIRTWNGTSAYQ